MRDTNVTEIKVFYGVIYYARALNLNSVTTKELFNKKQEFSFFATENQGPRATSVKKSFVLTTKSNSVPIAVIDPMSLGPPPEKNIWGSNSKFGLSR